MAKLNRIKVVLVEKQKTGKWLAEQLGKSNCTVSKWCSNTIQPNLETLREIAVCLDVQYSNNIQPDLNTLDNISKLLDVNIKDLLVDNKDNS